jgi:hypothetical protein
MAIALRLFIERSEGKERVVIVLVLVVVLDRVG